LTEVLTRETTNDEFGSCGEFIEGADVVVLGDVRESLGENGTCSFLEFAKQARSMARSMKTEFDATDAREEPDRA
jgi:hypothetical protein